MGQTTAVWLVVAMAFTAANVPFLSQRFLLVIPTPGNKSLALCLAELVVWYFVVGGLGLSLEKYLGQIAPQGWEFYAITGTLFITLAFPGFVWRYLLKHRN
jgi:Protein of unknown function (DUF2818)